MRSVDVIIVGAGPAGIGMAQALSKIEGLEYGVLEAQGIGASFQKWPAQTRFITPSFYSNPFGLADLNAVDAASSPSAFASAQHLSGKQYAEYLYSVAQAWELPILCDCKVLQVKPTLDGGFHLLTEKGELQTRFLIWACGEFQFPDLNPFPGGTLCQHYAHVQDWQMLDKPAYTVIGGYESGVDSAFNLVKLGAKVRLLVRADNWDPPNIDDPSLVLSPYTRERLREMQGNDLLEIVFGVNVTEVTQVENNQYRIHAEDGRHWDVEEPPILGTGFIKGGGARQIEDLWMWDHDGHVVLSDIDESDYTPGLFLVGPQVRHEERIYCFIYKFRQRFAGIAKQIAMRLQLDVESSEGSEDGVWGPFGNSECCEGCEC